MTARSHGGELVARLVAQEQRRTSDSGWAESGEQAAEGGQLTQVFGSAGGFFGGDHVGEVGDRHTGMVTNHQVDGTGSEVGVSGSAFGSEADIERPVIGPW